MAGSMVGDAARRMFNGWTRSRQEEDAVTISNRDEKNRRLSLDMSSSSSISLSPSEPVVDDTAPRLHKKASNTRLPSHRRPNFRSKSQPLSPIAMDDNPSTISSNDDQLIDQSTETDESKITVTINVSDPRSEHQEINYEIGGGGISVNQLNQNFEDSNNNNQEINSRNGSCQTSVTNSDETNSHINFDNLVSPLIPTTNDNNIPTQLNKKNSKPKLKVQRPQKEQNGFFTTQESEGEIESSSSSIPNTPKNGQDSTQEGNFVKQGNRRRRRKTKNSRNNSQQNSQQEINHSEQQKSLSSKHDNIQQNINGLPRSRQSDEMSYTTNWDKSTHDQQYNHPQQPRNKRNEVIFHSTNNSGTTIPAKVTLPDINKKKTTEFPRRNSQSNISSNSSMNRFISYAGAISSQNRPPPITTKISHEIPSTLPVLPVDSNITAPVPAASSVRSSTDHQWYSPFGSGLSIQFNSPVPPEDIHNKWTSNTSASLFSSPMLTSSNNRGTSTTPSSPISTSNETSSISMFASSPFSTLTNHERRNSNISLQTRHLTNFELNVTDEMIRGRNFKGKILNNKNKMSEGMINTDQGQNVPQFSLFDKQLSFR
ncbi:26734_t:CDS:2, partial [Dentiscutata erythropus]